MPDKPRIPPKSRPSPRALKIVDLVRPHWKGLTLALIAVLGETLTAILEPWPIKLVIDNILQSKPLPGFVGRLVTGMFGLGPYAVLNFAVAAVAGIAIVGAVSAYFEKSLTTSVSQWVGHDLRRTICHHIQRLSLAEHDKARTGDMITRVTSDIEVIQSFIDSALLGIIVNLLTLASMIGVMFYLNWRFTLIALSVMPVLFVVAYRYTARIKKASRAVRTKEGELLSVVEEVLTSIRVVKAFAREDYEHSLKPTDLPEMIAAHQQVLARKIREARPRAKSGTLFTPAAREAFRHASRAVLGGPRSANSRAYMQPDAPDPRMRLAVNGIYPDTEPIAAPSPALLAAFPPLPVQVAYRIVGRTLMVVDVESRLIVDLARRILPPAS